MNDIEKRKKFLDYYIDETKYFDLKEFILNNNIKVDNGAIILITPNQIIFTRNNPVEGDLPGSGSHDDTYDMLNKIIYNLPLNNRIFKIDSKELEDIIEKNVFVKNYQNIMIRMINEGTDIIHMKAMWIEFPVSITESQIEFLTYLENEYGDMLKQVSYNMVARGEDPLVAFRKNRTENVFCNSLAPAIEFAKNNLVKEKKKIIIDKHIIGITKEDILKKNKNRGL